LPLHVPGKKKAPNYSFVTSQFVIDEASLGDPDAAAHRPNFLEPRTMTCNPILEEIYAARDKLLTDCKGDIHAYVQDARERALASGRPIAEPKQRTERCAEEAKPDIAR
jgi:hypothetical protein